MPSPVAHGLAGLAVAHLALRKSKALPTQPVESGAQRVFWAVALAFAANAADLDFLPGFLIGDPNRFHHKATHTLLAAIIFGLGTTVIARLAGYIPWRRFGLFMGLSYLTHLVLDAVTRGSREPYGMEVFQPFSSEPLVAPFHVFLDIRRDGGTFSFLPSLVQRHNGEAIVREMFVMGGIWAGYWLLSSAKRMPPNGCGDGDKS